MCYRSAMKRRSLIKSRISERTQTHKEWCKGSKNEETERMFYRFGE